MRPWAEPWYLARANVGCIPTDTGMPGAISREALTKIDINLRTARPPDDHGL